MQQDNEFFLKQVARDILARFGNDLSRVTVVMPSRRARLFLDDYLAELSEQPVWAPQYCDLMGLFAQATSLQMADSLEVVVKLYNCYARRQAAAGKTTETFDEFYFFGEVLASDFSDVDKYLVDANMLFANLSDLDGLKDNFEHLDAEQWAMISRFFTDIQSNRTELKDAFNSIWQQLGGVYNDLRTELRAEGLAYEGMLMRDALSQLQITTDTLDQSCYLFVGFNLLTTAEQQLCRLLKHKALFYWDYDDAYINDKQQEAGLFLRENIKQFGQALDIDSDNLSRDCRRIEIVTSPSQTAQCGYIAPWIASLKRSDFTTPDTALVLCDEQLLNAAMHAIPDAVDCVNITMGYNLMQTPIAGLVKLLIELQQRGYSDKGWRYSYLLPVLHHCYVAAIYPKAAEIEATMTAKHQYYITSEDLADAQLFAPIKDAGQLADYLVQTVARVGATLAQDDDAQNSSDNLNIEAVFRTYQQLNRLKDLIDCGTLVVEIATLIGLIKRLLGATSVPFHGEPARGLQMMGMLETRNMDFRNVMLLSVNEGIIPKSRQTSSFIPQFIRRYFGMTTAEHQDAIYAYYFYRLMQRAENVALVYNTSPQAMGKAEKSRFLLQLQTEYGFPERIVYKSLKTELQTHNFPEISVAKNSELIARIRQTYNQKSAEKARSLSPSALNIYVKCRLQFYFKYIAGIEAPDELSDELDGSVLGNVLHKAAELFYRHIGKLPARQEKESYRPFAPFEVTKTVIADYLKPENRYAIEQFIKQGFDETYFDHPTAKDRYNGEQLIYFNVARKLFYRLLRLDLNYAPFHIVALEMPNYREVALSEELTVKTGGIIDRIDEKEGALRVVDYKTSSKSERGKNPVKAIADLFDLVDKQARYTFQACLYASIVERSYPERIVPILLYLPHAGDAETYTGQVAIGDDPISDFAAVSEEFDSGFVDLLKELFDENIPFSQCEGKGEKSPCKYCDYKSICGR